MHTHKFLEYSVDNKLNKIAQKQNMNKNGKLNVIKSNKLM